MIKQYVIMTTYFSTRGNYVGIMTSLSLTCHTYALPFLNVINSSHCVVLLHKQAVVRIEISCDTILMLWCFIAWRRIVKGASNNCSVGVFAPRFS